MIRNKRKKASGKESVIKLLQERVILNQFEVWIIRKLRSLLLGRPEMTTVQQVIGRMGQRVMNHDPSNF